MLLSQNGWPVLDADEVKQWRLPGTEIVLPLRPGHAGFVLVHFTLWFHEVVESLTPSVDDWGYSRRQIAGTDEWSNHASGTAVDLNANQHRGGDTFSAGDQAKIRDRLVEMDQVLRWGGDYRSPDDMHVEVNVEPSVLRSTAIRLQETPRGRRVRDVNRLR